MGILAINFHFALASVLPSLWEALHVFPGLNTSGLAKRRALVFLHITFLTDIQQTLTKQRWLVPHWHGSQWVFTWHTLGQLPKTRFLGCPGARRERGAAGLAVLLHLGLHSQMSEPVASNKQKWQGRYGITRSRQVLESYLQCFQEWRAG